MKKATLILLLFYTAVLLAQTTQTEDIGSIKITQKKCLKRKGYQLILKEVVSDSRCPEGVTCVWAGEVKVAVSLYDGKKLIQDEIITLSPMHKKEAFDWFAKYLPEEKRKIKSITVLPYPKQDVKINPKDYYLKIEYLK
ncbi:MAG TPA: hypothetical protein VK476_05085 [Flavobacterium sp.]|nr:hypothetical protein [Flavobacterium sp.]